MYPLFVFSEAYHGPRFEIMQVDCMKIFSVHSIMNIICIFHANCQKTSWWNIFTANVVRFLYWRKHICGRLLFVLFVHVNNFNTTEPSIHLVIIPSKVSLMILWKDWETLLSNLVWEAEYCMPNVSYRPYGKKVKEKQGCSSVRTTAGKLVLMLNSILNFFFFL